MKVNKEFKELIPDLTSDEREILEKSIIEHGCRDDLVVWDSPDGEVLIDGHNRFDICTENKIEYNTVFMEFDDERSVKEWIINNQFGRRNLSIYDRSMLALKLEDIYKPLAKVKMLAGVKETTTKSEEGSNPIQKSVQGQIKVQKIIAEKAGVSHDTIAKVKVITNKATDKQKEDLKSQTTSINNVYKDIKKKIKDDKRQEIKVQEKEDLETTPKSDITLYHGDCLEVCNEKIEDESIDHIITDFPYPYEFIDTVSSLGKIAFRCLKPGGLLITYSSYYVPEVIQRLTDEGMEYFWMMIVRHTGSKATVHTYNVRVNFKPIFIFVKPPINKSAKPYGVGHQWDDILEGSGSEKDAHPWQQSLDECKTLFTTFTEPGQIILDPFAGGGTTLIAGNELKRKMIGIEIDKKYIDVINERIS